MSLKGGFFVIKPWYSKLNVFDSELKNTEK